MSKINSVRRGVPMVTRIVLSFDFFLAVVMTTQIFVLGSVLGEAITSNMNQQFTQLAVRSAAEIHEKLNALTDNEKTLAASLIPYLHSKADITNVIAALGAKGALPDELDNVSFAWPDGSSVAFNGLITNVADQSFFQQAMQTPDTPILLNPVVSESTGFPVSLCARAVSDDSGNVAGVLQYPINLDGFATAVNDIPVGKHGFAWLVTKTGTVLSYPKSTYIMKSIHDSLGSEVKAADALEAVAKGDVQQGSLVYTSKTGADTVAFYARLPDESGWTIFLSVPKSDAYALVNQVVTLLVFFLVAALFVTTIVSILIARALARPIRMAALNFRQLAQGDADLTRQIPVRSADEIGTLLLDFNAFVSKLREIVVTLKGSQSSISSVSAQLEENANESAASLEQMKETITSVRTKAKEQASSAASSNEAVALIASRIEELDESLATQASSIVEASASIEEMAGTIEAVSKSAQKMSDEFQSISLASKEGIQIQETTGQLIGRIAAGSQDLDEANNVIAAISAQTNLLAMNAAIEAAHAGEAGKGFSVVADEIRKLAETSAEQSRSIDRGIKSVQDAINELVGSSEKLTFAFQNVDGKIEVTGGLVQHVSAAMMEQRNGSSQMLDALKSLNTVTTNVRAGSEAMKQSAETIVVSTRVLSQTASDISQGMDEMAESALAVSQAAQMVATLSGQGRSAVDTMESSVGRFKI